MPGQYLKLEKPEPAPDQHVRLERLDMDVAIVRRGLLSQRRIAFLGSDGRKCVDCRRFFVPGSPHVFILYQARAPKKSYGADFLIRCIRGCRPCPTFWLAHKLARDSCTSIPARFTPASPRRRYHYVVECQVRCYHHKSDEVMLQLVDALNCMMDRYKETRRRCAKLQRSTTVPVDADVRLVEDSPWNVSLLDVYEQHCERTNKDPGHVTAVWRERTLAAKAKGANEKQLLDTKITTIKEICKNTVPDSVFSHYMHVHRRSIFVPRIAPRVILIELRRALIPYPVYHTLSLALAGTRRCRASTRCGPSRSTSPCSWRCPHASPTCSPSSPGPCTTCSSAARPALSCGRASTPTTTRPAPCSVQRARLTPQLSPGSHSYRCGTSA